MAQLHVEMQHREFWYEDITLIPNRLPDFERDEVDLKTFFTLRVLFYCGQLIRFRTCTSPKLELGLLMELPGPLIGVFSQMVVL